jgi:histidinol-phosphatase (PHP family)
MHLRRAGAGAEEIDYTVDAVERYAEQAARGGVDEIGLSEHVWRLYFETLAEAVGTGFFDVLAHPDLAKIFGLRPDAALVAELHERTAEAIAAAGVAVEVSSAGLRKPVGELYPDLALLAACRERCVPLTLASDAHLAVDVGRGLGRALAYARAAGYDSVSLFEGRAARQEPLA